MCALLLHHAARTPYAARGYPASTTCISGGYSKSSPRRGLINAEVLAAAPAGGLIARRLVAASMLHGCAGWRAASAHRHMQCCCALAQGRCTASAASGCGQQPHVSRQGRASGGCRMPCAAGPTHWRLDGQSTHKRLPHISAACSGARLCLLLPRHAPAVPALCGASEARGSALARAAAGCSAACAQTCCAPAHTGTTRCRCQSRAGRQTAGAPLRARTGKSVIRLHVPPEQMRRDVLNRHRRDIIRAQLRPL